MNLAEESLVAEVTAQIVMELTHGASSSLHSFGFQALWDLYQLPYGQQYLHRLGRDNGPMHDLAKRVFKL